MGNAAKNHLSDKSFQDFYLSDSTLRALETIGYVDPTPVQAQSIPLVMAGIDLIVMSQTGTGKTAAFAIPTIEMLDPEPGRIDALILAPTRELAIQVAKEFGRLGQYKDLEVATIYGGTSYEKQYRALETANIISATPGRLLDLLKSGKCDLSELRVLILDEADEMLSMGFAEELDAILTFLPEERQSLLFSATITGEVKALSNKLLYYPEFISMSDDSVAAADVTHAYYPVRGVGRARDLLRVLEYEQPDTAIIFANTKADTFMVTKFLKRHGFRAAVINGDLPQKERERTLESLRKGETDFLVATDVAARGIDISDLSHVINFVLPDNAEVYVHRTGRTGRAGKKGRAVSLISPAEFATLFNMKKLYKIVPKKLSLPTTKQILSAKRKRHVEKLRSRLENTPGLPYGGKIGIAQHLLESEEATDSDNVRLVARLLALADKVAKGADTTELASALASEISAAAQTEAEPVSAKASADETDDRSADDLSDDDHSDDSDDRSETRKSSGRSRSNRRSKRRDDRSEKSERAEASSDDDQSDRKQADTRKSDDEQTASSKSDDAESGNKRRRRRRRRGSDDSGSDTDSSKRKSSSRSSGRKKSSRRSSGRKKSSRRSSGRRRSSGGKKSSRRSSDRKSSRRSSSKNEAPKAKQPEHAMSKLWVNMGRDQFDKPDDVVEMVCYMAGMDPEDIGSVSLESSFSYVEVREDYFYDIIKAMNQQDWNGETVAAEPARK